MPAVMIGRPTDWLLAIAGGVLLALMIHYNSLLAGYTTPTYASWVAHGLGAAAALVIIMLYSSAFRSTGKAVTQRRARVPLWCYLGGIPGAFTVILAAIAVNGGLGLSGTVALMLVGQVVFGITADYFGLFSTPRRRIAGIDLLVALLVLAGSMMIIFGGV